MVIKFVLKRNSPSSQTANNQFIAEYNFDGNLFTIGSDSGNNLVLKEAAFEQAVVVREGDHLKLINSADDTHLNGNLLNREAILTLNIGDELGIGAYSILITDSDVNTRIDTDQPIAQPPATDVFTTSEDKIVDIYATTREVPLDIYATSKFNLSELEEAAPPKSPGRLPANQNNIPLQPLNTSPPDVSQPEETTPQRNFAEILDTLRTEDDSFYFTVKNAVQEVKRIALDQAETPLGIASHGEIVIAAENIPAICAIARKDWSGILIEAQKVNAVSVNGERIAAPRRLRHDDEIVFTAAPKFSLVLHEPSSLVALESLLSTRPDADARAGNFGAERQSLTTGEATPEKIPKKSFLERRYFKYFSFVEFVSMIIGTLSGAVLIFLLLEFIFS